MSTVTAPQACLRRASAQAPGARYVEPRPPPPHASASSFLNRLPLVHRLAHRGWPAVLHIVPQSVDVVLPLLPSHEPLRPRQAEVLPFADDVNVAPFAAL